MRGLLIAIMGVIVAVAAALYGAVSLGPAAEVQATFQAYKAAYMAQSAEKVTSLTTDADINFMDQQRHLALTGDEAAVKALSFAQRVAIIGLRAGVLDGRMTVSTLKSLRPRELYAATRDLKSFPQVLAEADVLFVIPTGQGTARGYLTLTQLPPAFPGHLEFLALAQSIYFNFERQSDGRWFVDPTPLLAGSAAANEQMAKMIEPTGNAYLTLIYNQSKDPVREAMLWQPLAKE